MKENEFITTKKVVKAYKLEEYISLNIVGQKGYGKTTFAVKVATQVYMALGHSEDEAYKKALEVLFFDPNDVITFLKKYSGKQQPIMIWDDVRAHMSGYAVKAKPREAHKILALMDTARDSVAGFLSTSPSMQGTASFLKNETGWLVQIRKDKVRNMRVANGYLRYEIPSGTMKQTPRFVDSFHRKLPDGVYEIVISERRKYKNIAVRNIEESIKKAKDKQNEEETQKLQREMRYITNAI